MCSVTREIDIKEPKIPRFRSTGTGSLILFHEFPSMFVNFSDFTSTILFQETLVFSGKQDLHHKTCKQQEIPFNKIRLSVPVDWSRGILISLFSLKLASETKKYALPNRLNVVLRPEEQHTRITTQQRQISSVFKGLNFHSVMKY